MLEPAADVEGFLEANRDVFAGTIKTDMKGRADANLRGHGDITSFWREGNKDPKTTSYMASWRGQQFKKKDEIAQIVDKERTSCAGATVPDPRVVASNSARLKTFSKDLNAMLRTDFGYTGDSWGLGGTPSQRG